MLNRPTHTMTGDEFDVTVAVADWIRAGEPKHGKFFDALVDTGRRMVDVIDQVEAAAVTEARAEAAATE